MQVTIKNAKILLAASVVVAPWDFFMFGRNFGWGFAWAWGWFVKSEQLAVDQWLPLTRLLRLRANFEPVEPLYGWAVAGAVATVATIWVVAARYHRGTTTVREDRQIGAAFMLAGVIYIGSRFLLYDWLLVGERTDVYWISIPLGALWVVFVGAVFRYDLFRYGK